MKPPKTPFGPDAFAMTALGLKLYPWQIEILASCAEGIPTALLAPNGSGKSSVVLTSLILWFLSEFPKGRCVCTSGSWSQLKSTLFHNLKHYSNLKVFAGYEFLEATIKSPKGGWAQGFSVEDAYKLEGQHQDLLRESPVLVVVDEAKAIDDSVFEAIDKYTATYKIIVSSAGPPSGQLYRIFTTESKYWFRRKVTYRECGHLSTQQRLADLELRGENSSFYRNRWLSEFASDSGESIISLDALRACQANPPIHQPGMIAAGADFAATATGDSCVLAVANGNRVDVIDSWRHNNPKHSAGKFINLFRKLKLDGSQIFGDAGGLGIGFLADLDEGGYRIRPVHFGSPARNQGQYANRAAEMWDGFGVLVSNRRIILPANERLIAELSNRRKEFDSKGRIALESKADLRSRGASSPDVADAVVLAMMNGFGSLAANLNPAGAQHQAEILDYCHDLMLKSDVTLKWGSDSSGPIGSIDFSQLW